MASRASDILQQAIQQYQPGGAFEQKELGTLLRKRSQALASAFQGQVSRGLSGTSVPMANAARFEEEVGVPVRSSIETSRTQALTNAMLQRANILGQEQLASTEQRNVQKLETLNKSIIGSAGVGGGSSSGGMSVSGGGGGGGGGYFSPAGASPASTPDSYNRLGGSYEDPQSKIQEWESYIQVMKRGVNPKRISIEAAQKELAYWQSKLTTSMPAPGPSMGVSPQV